MKAWFLTGPNKLEMKEIQEPKLKPGYLIAEVLTAQASVTEANIITLENDPFGIMDRIKSDGKFSLIGHEMVGRVIAVNPDSKFEVGDRVSTLAKVPCGECIACKHGDLRYCENENLMGVTCDGIFSEQVLLRETGLAKVPKGLTNAEAANLQPIGDCVAAVESLVTFQPGCISAVWGAGCLGMNIMQILKAYGADKVIIVDIKEENLELARKLGADYSINGKETDPVEEIKRITDGRGADIIIEAAGGNPKRGLAGTAAMYQAIKALKPEGELHILAFYGGAIEFPIDELRTYGKIMSTPKLTTVEHMAKAGKMIEEKKIQVEPLITYRFDGIEKVPEMYRVTGNKSGIKSIYPAQVNFKK